MITAFAEHQFNIRKPQLQRISRIYGNIIIYSKKPKNEFQQNIDKCGLLHIETYSSDLLNDQTYFKATFFPLFP